jgi:hypothetical protein
VLQEHRRKTLSFCRSQCVQDGGKCRAFTYTPETSEWVFVFLCSLKQCNQMPIQSSDNTIKWQWNQKKQYNQKTIQSKDNKSKDNTIKRQCNQKTIQSNGTTTIYNVIQCKTFKDNQNIEIQSNGDHIDNNDNAVNSTKRCHFPNYEPIAFCFERTSMINQNYIFLLFSCFLYDKSSMDVDVKPVHVQTVLFDRNVTSST